MSITSSTGALRGSPALYNTNKFAIAFSILKEYYTDGVRDLLNSSTVLLKYMKRSDKFEVSGQYVVVPVRISRNEGHGHVREGGALPDPGQQGYDRATYRTHNFYGRIKFSGPSAAATRNRKGSYLDIIDSEVTGLVQDMSRDLNRIAYGDGSGRLATTTGAGASVTSIGVINPGGITNSGPGTQHLRVGMRVAFLDTSNPAVSNNIVGIRTLTSVDPETNVIGWAGGLTLPAAPIALVRISSLTSTSHDDSAYINEPFGLSAIISDTNPYAAAPDQNRLMGQIDRSTTYQWRSVVLDNNGTPMPFARGMLQKLLDEMEKASTSTPEVFITTHGIRLAYFEDLQASRRYPNTMKFDGGFETVHYADRPIVPDRDCTRGRIYGANFDAIQAYYEEDFHWMDRDGSFLHRLADQDAYQATLVRYHQFGTDMPNALGLITDLEDV